jgi:hypothetical protein
MGLIGKLQIGQLHSFIIQQKLTENLLCTRNGFSDEEVGHPCLLSWSLLLRGIL